MSTLFSPFTFLVLVDALLNIDCMLRVVPVLRYFLNFNHYHLPLPPFTLDSRQV